MPAPSQVAKAPESASGIAVVIPSYKVTAHILDLLPRIGAEVERIYVIDDCCPDGSGRLVAEHCTDPRVRVVFLPENQGVGGAVLSGYRAAVADGMRVVVKLDGDGQMDPALIPAFVTPILRGEADYTKGNRFFDVETMRGMPPVRLFGNIALSFLTKLSSGYWNLFDPTNGYTAIDAAVAARLPDAKIAKRYFFESDMLFRLNTLRAVVLDIPMFAVYGDEQSSLTISRELPRFLVNNIKNVGKRMVFNYLVRNFNFASMELILGSLLFLAGLMWGGGIWLESYLHQSFASTGTVMVPTLLLIFGFQMILGFINYDMVNIPTQPLQKRLHADARFSSPWQDL